MNVNTGRVYSDYYTAIQDGEDEADLVEVLGNSAQVDVLSRKVQQANERKDRLEELDRRRGR